MENDVEKVLDGDNTSEEGTNAYGNIKQLYIHKKNNRHLKTLYSIGGYDFSSHFKYALKNANTRKTFCDSAVSIMANWGFDGIDIDYEYPTTQAEGENFYQLIKQCRVTLDNYAKEQGHKYHYLLTIATSAGQGNYKYLDFKKITARVDNVLLMAYDYAGTWDDTTGHQANVYSDGTAATKVNTQDVLADYIRKGMERNKIVLGLPLYGRSFAKTHGLGKPYGGPGEGDEEEGVYLFKNLPRPGAKVTTNKEIIATYTYESKNAEFVTLEGSETTKLKAGYIKGKALAGAFFWRAAGDKTGSSSLITIMSDSLASKDKSYNQLVYPISEFDNIRNGMPGA